MKSYDPRKDSKHIIYLDTNNPYIFSRFNFLPTSGFKWIDPKELVLNKYTSYSSKACVFEVFLEYPKELWELNNNYPLAPDKIEIERKMLSDYQLKTADLYKIHIGNVKKVVPNFFTKNYVSHHENFQIYLTLGLKQRIYKLCIKILSI